MYTQSPLVTIIYINSKNNLTLLKKMSPYLIKSTFNVDVLLNNMKREKYILNAINCSRNKPHKCNQFGTRAKFKL